MPCSKPFRAAGLVVPALLLAATAHAGGPITSGSTYAGALSGPGYTESWTFSGTNGDRVVIGAVTTSGAVATQIVLKAPGGTPLVNTALDRFDFQLTATGTWTIEVSDGGLNDAGAYVLGFTNLTAGPLVNGLDADGGGIASNEIRNGTTGGVADFDAFTFAGSAGDRVVLTAVESSGPPYNTTMSLYGPAGAGVVAATSGGNRLEHQLAAGGTYTLVIEDVANDHAGGYTVSFLNLTAGPLTSVGDTHGGPIVSNVPLTGNISGVGDLDAFTFSGTNGDRVIVAGLATSGSLATQVVLYPPAGGLPIVNTALDRFDVQLTASGTWTILVEDGGNDAGGDYTVALLELTAGPLTDGSDADGGGIASNEIRNGTTGGLADFDAFTFTGAAGDRVVLTAVETGGASYNTTMSLYGPAGAGVVAATSGGNRMEHQLAAGGTYTLVIEDVAVDHAGAYTVSFLNLTAGPLTSVGDTHGGPIVSNVPLTGNISGVGDLDAFTFSGTNGDRVIVAGLATSGSLATQVVLYPPNGGLPIVNTALDRFDAQLTASGTWTILVEDGGNDAGGDYTVALLELTAGPLTDGSDADGGGIASNEIRNGTTGGLADFDAFTFTGAAGDRVLFTAVETGGASYNTTMTLYGPSGAGAVTSTSGGNRLDHQLAAGGTYTLVIEDVAVDHTGAYTVSFLNLTAGPLTSLGDPDGGTIVSNQPRTGTISGTGDLDAFTFQGGSGQRVIVGAPATGGALATQVVLYPPAGGLPIVNTALDRFDAQLTASGTWTILVEDGGNDAGGDYTVSLLEVTAGPLTDGLDGDGGAIQSSEWRTGATGGAGDFDAFTFDGVAGQRVLVTAVETGGASYNTQLTIYPPGGGALETSTSGGNRLDHQLLATGTYTVVVEDVGIDHAGAYSIQFVDVTHGPYTFGADTDGGLVVSGDVRNGTISPLGDVDVFSFHGASGETAQIGAVGSSGLFATQIVIYPPGGGAPVVNTGLDNVNHVLTATGYHAVSIEDGGLDGTGGYTFTLNGSLTTVDVPAPGAAPFDPARAVMKPAYPNPFRSEAAIAWSLPARSAARLRVYDLRGALVRTLVDGTFDPGARSASWDGRDDAGETVGAGVYFAELRAGGEVVRRKLVRMR